MPPAALRVSIISGTGFKLTRLSIRNLSFSFPKIPLFHVSLCDERTARFFKSNLPRDRSRHVLSQLRSNIGLISFTMDRTTVPAVETSKFLCCVSLMILAVCQTSVLEILSEHVQDSTGIDTAIDFNYLQRLRSFRD